MTLVAGSSGILGSGFVAALRARGEPCTRLPLPWPDPDRVAGQVLAHWSAARRAAPGEPITLVWAAGTGSVGAPADQMAAETEVLRAVAVALAGRERPDPRDCVLFASSAGALYGGHRGGMIREVTPTTPITPYGREKLAQEQVVSRLADDGGMRVVACRYTNIYGLASGRLRRRGLVAALVESALLRTPARLFVSQDTRRDYLYNVDAARQALAEADAIPDGTAAVRIIRAGCTMTVQDVVTGISRVLGRRVPVVLAESPESLVQPRELSFEPRRGIQAAVPTTSFPASIRAMAEAPRA